jgi:hypothetical protein
MALIDPNNPAGKSLREILEEQLNDYIVLLSDVNVKLHNFELEQYAFNSSQNSTSARNTSYADLIKAQEYYLKKIRELNIELGLSEGGPIAAQVVPL